MRIWAFHGRGAAVVYYGTMGAATEWTGLFIKEAMAVMYEQDKRIVRRINARCDQCLSAGAIEHVLEIDNRLVQLVGQVI